MSATNSDRSDAPSDSTWGDASGQSGVGGPAMRVGTAFRDITPDRPLHLLGQMAIRLGEYTHDPLTVNAVVFDDSADKSAIVSVDVCVFPTALADSLKGAASQASGIAPERITIAATHTHVAPCTTSQLFGECDSDWLEQLSASTAAAVKDAVADCEEVSLYTGSGWLEHMGWNRRGLRRDGAAHMYLGSWGKDFVGIEGPRDGEVPVVFARRPDGTLKAVVSSFSTHPNTVEGESFYSADIPGEVRRVVRAVHGEDVGFVYLTGAAGNTAPSIMVDNVDNVQPWRGEEGLKRSGQYLGGEILRIIAAATDPMPDPVLRHERIVLDVPVREWDENVPIEEFGGGMYEFFAQSRDTWDDRRANHSPEPVAINVLRVGDAAVCTSPAELYSEFGLAIKEASPAAVTLVGELTDGWCGYVPTPQAVRHGGYSAQASDVAYLEPDAGWRIVEATREMLDRAFGEG